MCSSTFALHTSAFGVPAQKVGMSECATVRYAFVARAHSSLVLKQHCRTFAPALHTLGSAGTPTYWKWQWLAMIIDHGQHQEEQAESGWQKWQ